MRKETFLSVSLLFSIICCTARTTEAVKEDKDLISTPFGPRPAQCVHVHPSSTAIRETAEGVEAVTPEGTLRLFPALDECIEYDKQWRARHTTKNGWLDNAGSFPSKPITEFTGNYLVPNDPKAGRQVYWLYYFLGIENSQSNVSLSILQPVLSWSANGWTFSSWNCCPAGQVHQAQPVPTSANQTITGLMKQQGSTWVIDSIAGNQHSTLHVATNNRIFNYADATLETYYVKDCSYFPTMPLVFSHMTLQTTGGIETPHWSTTGATECSGKTTVVSPSEITIKHN